MTGILQKIFSNEWYWINACIFDKKKNHWTLFTRVQLTMSQRLLSAKPSPVQMLINYMTPHSITRDHWVKLQHHADSIVIYVYVAGSLCIDVTSNHIGLFLKMGGFFGNILIWRYTRNSARRLVAIDGATILIQTHLLSSCFNSFTLIICLLHIFFKPRSAAIFLGFWRPFWMSLVRKSVTESSNSPHKGQWRGALMFSLICAWTNGWVNNRDAGDSRRCRAHYDVTVMGHNCSQFFYRSNMI